MVTLRGFLLTAWLIVMAIGIEAYHRNGMAAGETFMSDIQALSWRAQFNLDFLAHLLLFGLWIAWRHHFKPAGLALGLACVLGGGAVSLAYLLCASLTIKGDVKALLLGEKRDEAIPSPPNKETSL
ncbi:hypothetical protein ACNFH8_02930 [Pseudomonas sp. NY15436]|uniref:hypothetical protein n=1 Tax=Pseudomonas sp. NY15436 TaxID=3400359 RepID=UPI003A8BDE90